ncbi:MAG: DNA translocase FtsK 4TM domain-containing protein [Rhodospirillaceae bacterium]
MIKEPAPTARSAMARAGSRSERARLLSLAFINLLKQRVAELTGLGLILSGALLGAALASYFPGDPSWNTIKSTGAVPIYNLLGLPGAYVSDLVVQIIGLAGFLAVGALTVWGIRVFLLFTLPRPLWLAIQLGLACVCAAVAFQALSGLFLRDNPGGSLGLLLLGHLAGAKAAGMIPVALSSAVLGVLLYAGALGIPVLRSFHLIPLARAGGRALWLLVQLPFSARRRQREEAPEPARSGRALYDAALAAIRPEAVESSHAAGNVRVEPRFGAPAASGSAEADPAAQSPHQSPHQSPAPSPRTTLRPIEQEPQEPLPYELPPLDLLRPAPVGETKHRVTESDMSRHAESLTGVLSDFGVRGSIQSARPGPVVTLYELEPAPGTKSSRVIGLADDIARSMSAVSVRVAVVPGRNVIGIELPNPKRETVWLRDLLETEAYSRTAARLALVLGKDIGGTPVIADLARMPHLLIAGTTGSGKSVGINTMILSLLYRMEPENCKFIMVDPKMLELSVYDGIPHLLAPVVTDPKRAVVALKWTVREMEDRYRAMSKLGVRNIEGYNARLRETRDANGALSRRVQVGFDPDTGKPLFEEQPLDLKELPYIVVVVDEMADLMLVAGKDIEAAIQRLAQMARAAGIHLIMATQRPSVDVITGTIKANFPTRISFQVTSKIDSRTILGEQGAEQLLGQGDMLYMAGGGRITRVHGPFVSDEEVESVVRFLKARGEPTYVDAVTEETDEDGEGERRGGASSAAAAPAAGATGGEDELYDKAVALVCRERKVSTSFVQRFLRVGYNSAARLIERMEQDGVISKPNHAGKREVLAQPLRDEL